jgi:hypothetical protein
MRRVTPATLRPVTEKELSAIAAESAELLSELKEHRDERRALLEAIFRVMDRLD